MKFNVRLEGITPLICNRFHDEAAMAATSGSRSSAAGQERGTPMEQATKKVYTSADGKRLIIPQPNLLRCLVDGGTFHKVGKAQVTTKEKSMLFSCIDIAVSEIDLIYKQPWRVDTRAIVIPSTKGRILTHRPMFDDWALAFEIYIDGDIITPNLVRAIIDDAGKRVGLGDFRPARKGPYGRFVVTLWEQVVEQPLKAVA